MGRQTYGFWTHSQATRFDDCEHAEKRRQDARATLNAAF